MSGSNVHYLNNNCTGVVVSAGEWSYPDQDPFDRDDWWEKGCRNSTTRCQIQTMISPF